jgi:hypothetical protein
MLESMNMQSEQEFLIEVALWHDVIGSYREGGGVASSTALKRNKRLYEIAVLKSKIAEKIRAEAITVPTSKT